METVSIASFVLKGFEFLVKDEKCKETLEHAGKTVWEQLKNAKQEYLENLRKNIENQKDQRKQDRQ